MEVRVYRSASELDEVREFWTAAQRHPNSDLEHFLLVCASRADVIGPIVLGVWEKNRCCCLVVGRLERAVLQSRIGYANVLRMPATVISILQSGVIGTVDGTCARGIVSALDTLLRRGEADLATINLIPEGVPLWAAFGEIGWRVFGARAPHWSNHRQLLLKPEPGFLLRNMRSKHRSWIKRKERELEMAFPGRVRWTSHRNITTLVDLCAKMELVARRTYQRGLGAGFINDEETRRRLALFANRGHLRAYLMEIDDEAKAFWLGEVYKGTFHSSATAFTTEMREFEVGTLLFLRIVDELVQEGVKRLDFGLGDAHYKERFSDKTWREATVQMFAPTRRGIQLLAAIGVGNYTNEAVRKVARRLGLVDRIKKLWRGSLAEGTAREPHSLGADGQKPRRWRSSDL